MSTFLLASGEVIDVATSKNVVALNFTKGFIALSKQITPKLAREIGQALIDAADKAGQGACPPCSGNCNQGRACPAKG